MKFSKEPVFPGTVKQSAGMILTLILCACSSAAGNDSTTANQTAVKRSLPKHTVRITADTKFYATTQAFCNEAFVMIKKAAAAISGDDSGGTEEADGVSTLSNGMYVVVTAHPTRTCTYELDGEEHTPFKDWPLTEVTVLGDDNTRVEHGYVETNGFQHS